MSKIPDRFEFIEHLKASYELCHSADDAGTIDHEMARWQEWVNSWPKIGTEEGGI